LTIPSNSFLIASSLDIVLALALGSTGTEGIGGEVTGYIVIPLTSSTGGREELEVLHLQPDENSGCGGKKGDEWECRSVRREKMVVAPTPKRNCRRDALG
jgi:hypothetical protein